MSGTGTASEPPAVVALDVSIRLAEVHRYMGYPEGKEPAPRIAEIVGTLVDEARRLVRSRGCFVLLPTERAADIGLDVVEADGLAVGLVTAGRKIEDAVAMRLCDGESTAPLVLDAAGTAAAEEAADRLCAIIGGVAPPRGDAPAVPCRLSPGYGDWPLEAQRALFDVLPAEALGVELLPSMLMVPRKSVTFAMWLGAGARPGDAAAGCSRCGLDRCRYRRDDRP